jgi:hypothetical protein
MTAVFAELVFKSVLCLPAAREIFGYPTTQCGVADIVLGGQSLQPFEVGYLKWDGDCPCFAGKCYRSLSASEHSFMTHVSEIPPLTPPNNTVEGAPFRL